MELPILHCGIQLEWGAKRHDCDNYWLNNENWRFPEAWGRDYNHRTIVAQLIKTRFSLTNWRTPSCLQVELKYILNWMRYPSTFDTFGWPLTKLVLLQLTRKLQFYTCFNVLYWSEFISFKLCTVKLTECIFTNLFYKISRHGMTIYEH